MKIIVKCWTAEWYDNVTHAVIEFDTALVDNLLEKFDLAARIETEQKVVGNHFMGLEFDSCDPIFIDLDDPEELGIDEEKLEDGYLILPANLENHEWDETRMCTPVMQCVMSPRGGKGRVYWYGYDKHGDAGCRAETYSLYEADLRAFKEALLCRSTSSK